MAAIESTMQQLLLVFGVAAGVRVVAERLATVSYTILLVLTGLAISISSVEIGLPLTHDVILFVILPTILFFGAIRLDVNEFRQHLAAILLLVGIGLPLAVVLLGLVGWRIFGFPPRHRAIVRGEDLPARPGRHPLGVRGDGRPRTTRRHRRGRIAARRREQGCSDIRGWRADRCLSRRKRPRRTDGAG